MVAKILVRDYLRPARRACASRVVLVVLPDMQITAVNQDAGILLKCFALLF
jgi:hypothetical protein